MVIITGKDMNIGMTSTIDLSCNDVYLMAGIGQSTQHRHRTNSPGSD